jgi:hypothetical protein
MNKITVQMLDDCKELDLVAFAALQANDRMIPSDCRWSGRLCLNVSRVRPGGYHAPVDVAV